MWIKKSGKELKGNSTTCWLSAWDRMALAASSGLSTSMLVGLRRASAVEELLGEIMKHGLSMTVICLSKGTTCMLLKKTWNYRVTGLSKRKRTNMKLRVGLNKLSTAVRSNLSSLLHVYEKPSQNPKVSTACSSAMYPNFTVPINLPSPAPSYLLMSDVWDLLTL